MGAISIHEVSLEPLRPLIPYPKVYANKYTRGTLTIIGGEACYPGALCLACRAGSKMGAGYVRAFCAPETLVVLHGYDPTIVGSSWEDEDAVASSLLAGDAGHPQACLIGSGFDAHSDRRASLIFDVLDRSRGPVVIDGGAITTLASTRGISSAQERASRGLTTLITPHFGEAHRLAMACGCDEPPQDSQDARLNGAYAKALADAYGATMVLKGADTYIADPFSSEVHLMAFGGPCLAKAGTGDVLAGMVASLLAQGVAAKDAALLGTTLHALCGREAAERLTEVCVNAEDLIDCLPLALRLCAQK